MFFITNIIYMYMRFVSTHGYLLQDALQFILNDFRLSACREHIYLWRMDSLTCRFESLGSIVSIRSIRLQGANYYIQRGLNSFGGDRIFVRLLIYFRYNIQQNLESRGIYFMFQIAEAKFLNFPSQNIYLQKLSSLRINWSFLQFSYWSTYSARNPVGSIFSWYCRKFCTVRLALLLHTNHPPYNVT